MELSFSREVVFLLLIQIAPSRYLVRACLLSAVWTVLWPHHNIHQYGITSFWRPIFLSIFCVRTLTNPLLVSPYSLPPPKRLPPPWPRTFQHDPCPNSPSPSLSLNYLFLLGPAADLPERRL
ncbi:unnamed protein product [Chondrus crispus]|uniref:Uncharacterized protein n=1 Tax=Chondrus crispus TaxID=2769 RepID=R7Q4U8_CHOCR|nr:unnamed protein product [Chondrus crispus]CDF33029.1 unnamed protein product [Chondrus crispus]|eukprot:XP_005712832.1 unnamed protein product [Chondrus crispus]